MKKHKITNGRYCVFLVMFTSCLFLAGWRSDIVRFAPIKSENDWISKVHVVFMNHLDVGYTDLINNVLNQYFQIYFDHAIQLSASLRNLGYVENMVYTTHPWLLSLYLNCPPNFVLSGIKLKCPDQKQRNDFVEAIRRGDITWHAGPMNLQIEFIEPWLFEAALDISSDLDKKFNITRKCRVISQRDVPGLTQASIPILIKKGITYLTVGVNGATPPPGVPKLFKWKYGKDSIVVNVHPGGYPDDPGSTTIDPKGLSREDCITHQGFSEALCFVFRTDNAGPPASIQEVLNMYEILRAEFPRAVLVSGTLENFFALFDDQLKDTLPTITNEIGDVWIQGIASDPKKNAEYLFISNKIKNCIDSGVCSLNDRRLWNASRFLIKLPEHTWGYYSENDTELWNNTSFEPLRKVNPNFIYSANSWWEQRNFSLTAIEALEDHVIAQEIKNEMPFLNAVVPDLMEFLPTKTRQFSCPTANINNLLFGEDGTILRLTFQDNVLADEKHVLGKFVYQTFNETDFEEFGKVFNYSHEWSAGYFKPNCTSSARPESKIWNTVLNKIYINKLRECDFWLHLNMNDSKSVSWYGAPSEIWIRYSSRIAKHEKASSQELYIGCYKSFSGTLSRLNRIRSVSQCLTECRSQLSLFTAIAGGSSCYCGVMETNTRVPSSNCNKTCIDNNGICGGNNFFAVYTGVPAYQGCFRDNNYDRDLINMIMNDQRMTIDKCYEICSSNNYKYSGVQYAKECFCGQQYGRHGKVSESDCDMSCSGDANQICGGGSRNNVYSVGYLQGLNQGYSEVFHCLNGATNLHGTCINISCQRGWKGTKCNQRDCTINNGNCGRHKCQEIIIGNQIISECVCEEGFRSISIYDECKDIDECTFNVCDIKTSTCSNTIGSYNCICKEGFARHLSNQFLCEVSYEEFYIGCNRNFSGISIKKYPIQSISQCLNECKRQASSFAALKDGSSCYCGNTTNRRVPSSNCNSPCSDNNGICGGNNLFAVYTDIPTYQGCFKDDNNNRDMNLAIHGDWTMTIEKCYERCSSTNYSFMGVQIGGFCYCGQQYGKHGRAPETECNVACNGNGNQICGGPARNSIYSVGQIPGLNKNYSELFHCLNGATDKNGTCSSKTCQHGWKGKKCNQRDCITNNGNCGQHKCAEIKIGNQIISECVCKEGFQSISIYDACTDIDECQRSPCNKPSETCNNTVGSYMCTCSPGYNYINQLGFNDQCNGSHYECENSTTCVKVQNYKFSSKDSNFSESLSNDQKVIILATFLVLSLSALVIATVGLLFCKRKVRELQAKLMKQKNTIQGSAGNNSISTYQQLDASSPSKDPHNYSELVATSCEELYGGCYKNFSGFSIDKNPIQSISQCLTECRKYLDKTSFSAIKDGSSCYCGYLTYTRVPLSNCNLTCGDNNGICGGNNLFSVYMEIPTNEGCFKDDINSRAMKLAIENDLHMTIDKCYERCSSLNCTFMAVQAGGSCYCDKQYTLYGRAPESECNMTCTGDGKQICGGPARNNIYTVEVITTLGKFYDQLFHCLNGATDMHGTCSSKTCQPGWKGTKCNQRDCTINNGNCGQHTCQEYKISNQVISECVCKEGFRSISIYDECKDIEECYLNMCNLTTSTCNNTIGSFDCICKEGFVKIPLNQVDYKGEYDKKLKELTCVRKECDKQRPFVEDKRDIIILATFLTFFICTQIILISAVLFYRSKNRKLAMTIRERNTDAMSDSTYRHLDFSSQCLDDHNYSELAKNNELKK